MRSSSSRNTARYGAVLLRADRDRAQHATTRTTTRTRRSSQDGDLVQFDYAPDYKYYVSDVTRVFPANGKFTPRQREFYTIYLQLYQALMSSIKVHASPRDVIKDAVVKMDAIMATFSSPIEDQGRGDSFVDALSRESAPIASAIRSGWRCTTSGTADADAGARLIFTIEPAMQIVDEHLGIRLEDMILMTEKGYENLSAFVPVEIDAIEKLMAQPGLSDHAIK